jgi:hypothetical protein
LEVLKFFIVKYVAESLKLGLFRSCGVFFILFLILDMLVELKMVELKALFATTSYIANGAFLLLMLANSVVLVQGLLVREPFGVAVVAIKLKRLVFKSRLLFALFV